MVRTSVPDSRLSGVDKNCCLILKCDAKPSPDSQVISIIATRVWFYFCSLLYVVSNAAFLWFKPDYRTPLYLAGTAIFFFAR
jgi:hypothetical protein